MKCRLAAAEGGVRGKTTAWLLEGEQRAAATEMWMKCLISMGGNSSHEVREPFCFYYGLAVEWILQVPWIKHAVPWEDASWREGQLANCSKRLKWQAIRKKCAESRQFDWKSCRGKIVGDRVQIQNPVFTGTLLSRARPFEDYINITAKHVITNWGHAPDSADNFPPHRNFL